MPTPAPTSRLQAAALTGPRLRVDALLERVLMLKPAALAERARMSASELKLLFWVPGGEDVIEEVLARGGRCTRPDASAAAAAAAAVLGVGGVPGVLGLNATRPGVA